jgi:ribonuclease HIII
MMFIVTLGIVWLINQRRSTKINVYKTRKIIINGNHQQNGDRRRSSTRKSLMCGTNINMGNVNYQ